MSTIEAASTLTRSYEREVATGESILLADARSQALRELEDSLPIRNSNLVVPETVPKNADDLLLFVETQAINSTRESVCRYVRDKMQRYKVGQTALGSREEAELNILPLSGRLDTALLLQSASWFGFRYFHDVNSPIIRKLDELDLRTAVDGDHRVQQNGLVLRALLSTLESIEMDLTPLARAQGAQALGYRSSF